MEHPHAGVRVAGVEPIAARTDDEDRAVIVPGFRHLHPCLTRVVAPFNKIEEVVVDAAPCGRVERERASLPTRCPGEWRPRRAAVRRFIRSGFPAEKVVRVEWVDAEGCNT